ncbi:hypothetical protein BLA13014_02145 [Burkholderia aenigmatica]|uniref:Uncharacterized protein n=1 Tax=Burkholderia aenigmatica TaxID=2015348 RepID=A0A6P2JYX3_9BURK|nr:hypothetical protein BLA13014_02145 [Burkholderia aenigmatica]
MGAAIRAGRMNGLKTAGTPEGGAQARRAGPYSGVGIFIVVAPVPIPGAAFVRRAQGDALVTLDRGERGRRRRYLLSL